MKLRSDQATHLTGALIAFGTVCRTDCVTVHANDCVISTVQLSDCPTVQLTVWLSDCLSVCTSD